MIGPAFYVEACAVQWAEENLRFGSRTDSDGSRLCGSGLSWFTVVISQMPPSSRRKERRKESELVADLPGKRGYLNP
jgi:hypothetical protein